MTILEFGLLIAIGVTVFFSFSLFEGMVRRSIDLFLERKRYRKRY